MTRYGGMSLWGLRSGEVLSIGPRSYLLGARTDDDVSDRPTRQDGHAGPRALAALERGSAL